MSDFISKYGTQLIAGFIAIIGILLGLFWTQFFAWRKNKREQKAKLNHLLFHLLELYYFVSRNNIPYVVKIYVDHIEKRFKAISREERVLLEQEIIAEIKEKLINLKDEEEIRRLSEHYESAVKEIAYINPFLAYRLAGQSKNLNKLDKLKEFFISFRNLLDTEEEQNYLKIILENYSDEKLINEMIEYLKKSVLDVSKEIGKAKHAEAKKHFISQEKGKKEELEKEVTQFVDQIVRQKTGVQITI